MVGEPFFMPVVASSARTAGTKATATSAASRRDRVNMARSFRTDEGEVRWGLLSSPARPGMQARTGGLGNFDKLMRTGRVAPDLFTGLGAAIVRPDTPSPRTGERHAPDRGYQPEGRGGEDDDGRQPGRSPGPPGRAGLRPRPGPPGPCHYPLRGRAGRRPAERVRRAR